MYIEHKIDAVDEVVMKAEYKLRAFLIAMKKRYGGQICSKASMLDDGNCAILRTRVTLKIENNGNTVYITVRSSLQSVEQYQKLEILLLIKNERDRDSSYYVGEGNYKQAIAYVKTDLDDAGFSSMDQLIQV